MSLVKLSKYFDFSASFFVYKQTFDLPTALVMLYTCLGSINNLIQLCFLIRGSF